jgi:hypothetical protein
MDVVALIEQAAAQMEVPGRESVGIGLILLCFRAR